MLLSARPYLGVIILAFILAACASRPAPEPALGDRDPLEAQLARLPQGRDASSTLARARILAAFGRQEQALGEIEVAQGAARETLDLGALAALSQSAGDLYLELGRPEAALSAFGAALKSVAGMESPVFRARALVDIAYALALLGSMTRADEAVGEARLAAGEKLVEDPRTAERLGLVEARLLRDDQAIDLLARARDGYARLNDRTGAARADVLRAGLSSRRNVDRRELDAAEAWAFRSLDPDPLARLRRFQAEASMRAGHATQCEREADEAVRLADPRGLVEVAKAARVVYARCAGKNGRLRPAIQRADEAAAIAEEQRRQLSGDVARKEMGFEAFQIYRLLLSLQARLPEAERVAPVFETMERARARAHLDALLRSRAGLGSISTETMAALSQNKAEAEAEIRRLTRELSESRSAPNLFERHRDALWALEDIKEAMAQANPLVTRIRVPAPPTLSELRKTLIDDRTVMLAYFVAEEDVLLVGMTSKEERMVKLGVSPEELGQVVRAYRRDVLLDPDVASDVVEAEGKKLYRKLFGELGAWVSAHEALVIVPHGELSVLPFEALVDERGKFVVETHELSYGISATLAAELSKRRRPEGKRIGFVGMGDPVYDWPSYRAGKPEGAPEAASRALELWIETQSIAAQSAEPGAEPSQPAARPILERLPGTEAEIQAIAKLFGDDQRIYLRAEASEDNVARGVFENARIVHVASHGLLEPHFQALALTLNPEAKEDGFLMQSEIIELRLDADLVVLSACQTGQTKLRSGEPVAGLALALRSAGAERVVLSLWSVDDQATSRLMVDFYRPLVNEGKGYAAALAAAKRKMISSGERRPFYWAPFVLIGH